MKHRVEPRAIAVPPNKIAPLQDFRLGRRAVPNLNETLMFRIAYPVDHALAQANGNVTVFHDVGNAVRRPKIKRPATVVLDEQVAGKERSYNDISAVGVAALNSGTRQVNVEVQDLN